MKESEFLLKYLWFEHREDPQWRRVRVGLVPDHELARMYAVTLRWADAIVLHKGEVLIIESKLRADLGAVGQLLGYKELFRVTPEFSAYKDWPIRLQLLIPFTSLDLVELCSKNDIDYITYTYEEIEEKIKEERIEGLKY